MTAERLSPVMRQTLKIAITRGALVRWPGGWWTYPGCDVQKQQPSAWRETPLQVPDWSIGVGTVLALVKRDLLMFTERDPRTRQEIKVVPTDKARSLS